MKITRAVLLSRAQQPAAEREREPHLGALILEMAGRSSSSICDTLGPVPTTPWSAVSASSHRKGSGCGMRHRAWHRIREVQQAIMGRVALVGVGSPLHRGVPLLILISHCQAASQVRQQAATIHLPSRRVAHNCLIPLHLLASQPPLVLAVGAMVCSFSATPRPQNC